MARRKVKHRALTKSSIGDMRAYVSLERRTQSVSLNSPEARQNLVSFANVWAKAETVEAGGGSGSGDFIYAGINVDTRNLNLFTIRYRDDVFSSNTYIRWEGTLYRILFVRNPEERGEYLTLVCNKQGDESLEANQ